MLADVSVTDIAQRYRMQNVLGSGAQATVYQAMKKGSQVKRAVKVQLLAVHTRNLLAQIHMPWDNLVVLIPPIWRYALHCWH